MCKLFYIYVFVRKHVKNLITKKPTNNLQIVSRFCELECRCLEAETCHFIEAEHDIHVLYGLAYSTFQ